MISHLVCVMDGNRRWAKSRGLMPWMGHKAGAHKVQTVIEYCLQNNIRYLSLYTFSLENFKRSEDEKSYLFDLVMQQASQYVQKFIDHSVAVKFIGDLARFPESVQQICAQMEAQTAGGIALHVNFLFGYSARQEIIQAAIACAEKFAYQQEITAQAFEQNLWTSGTPDPDLILRTGGVQRLSNCLLYQAAYAEIRFLDVLWPDITIEHIHEAVKNAAQAQKNIGA